MVAGSVETLQGIGGKCAFQNFAPVFFGESFEVATLLVDLPGGWVVACATVLTFGLRFLAEELKGNFGVINFRFYFEEEEE